MTANDAWIIYKKLDDEIQACEVPLQNYITYKLTDERKLKLFKELVDADINIEKFFLANFTLNKEFYIDYYEHNRERCMTLYYSWDEFLVKKRHHYFIRVIEELKKGLKLDLNDRDKFLEEIQATDYLLWSVLYPENLELLLSLEDDWVKYHLPEYNSQMEYIKKVIRGHLVLKQMKGFDKLREKALQIITK